MTALGEVIETARRAQGLTQDDLAHRIGVSQVAISRYENGLREPEADVLPRLASALGVTEALLQHAGRARAGMALDAHMRRRATAPPGVWKRLEAKLNMYRFHSGRLFEQIDLHAEQSVPSIDPAEVLPADAARMVRMQWRMPLGPVRRLVRWLEAAGCLVVSEPFETRRVDGLSQWAGEHPVILINENAPTDRVRLTLAHELGHLVLHSGQLGDDVEAEANDFAAEFLMPAEYIRPSLRNVKIGQLRDLKLEYGVSMQALVERAYHLQLLTAGQRTSMYKMFSARGWRTVEPLSDELAPERPELVYMIGRDLVASGLRPAEVASMAGFSGPERNTLFRCASPGLRAV